MIYELFIYWLGCSICRVKGTGHMIVLGVFVMIRNSWRALLSLVTFLAMPSSPHLPFQKATKTKREKCQNPFLFFFIVWSIYPLVHVQLTLAFGIWLKAIMACSCTLSGYLSTNKQASNFVLTPCLLLLPCVVLCRCNSTWEGVKAP